MATTQKIDSLMLSIENNQYFLPEFQRGYVWTSDKVKEYFQSLYLGYPTGAFLVWKAKNPPKMRGDILDDNHEFKQLILDGQQRLTTLYVILKGKQPPWFEGKALRTDLYFNLETAEFQYYTKPLMHGKREWIDVSSFLQQGVGQFIALSDNESKTYFVSHFDTLGKLEAIHQYTYYIQDIEEQDAKKVVAVFNLVNSAGTPLSQADLTLAVVTSRWEQCKDKMREASIKHGKNGFHFSMEFFLRCMTVVATHRGKFDDVTKLSKEELVDVWKKVEKALDYLINIMVQHAYVDSTQFLTTLYAFFPLVYYLSNNGFTFLDPKSRDKFLYWFYSSLIWGRYSGSSETVLDQDIRTLKETNSVDELVKTLALSRGGNLDVTAEDLELQGMRSRFYQLIYVVIRSNGAADWADPSLALYHKGSGQSYSIERHHIFPKSKLYKIYSSNRSYDRQLVNEIANMAFLTSETNHTIFNNDPDIYLPDVDPEQLRRQYVPLEVGLWRMQRNSFEGFLKERRRLLAENINKFLHKLHNGATSIHVVVDGDIWQDRVEEIEYALRDIIVKTYDENEEDINWSYIPTHILPKVKNRVQKYLKDNPSEDKNVLKSIELQINFFDVSEYHALIVNKENWQYFEPIFGDKTNLQQRFTQLQNLRNTLAHNRGLSDVIVKDGEAALLWFSSALRKFD